MTAVGAKVALQREWTRSWHGAHQACEVTTPSCHLCPSRAHDEPVVCNSTALALAGSTVCSIRHRRGG